MEFEEPRAAAFEHAHQTLSTTFVVGHVRPTRPVLLAGSRQLRPESGREVGPRGPPRDTHMTLPTRGCSVEFNKQEFVMGGVAWLVPGHLRLRARIAKRFMRSSKSKSDLRRPSTK